MPDPAPPVADSANPAAAATVPLLAAPAAAAAPQAQPPVAAPATNSATPAAAASEAAPPATEPVYDFKLPDTVAKDDPGVAAFSALCKESKIAPEAAQKIIDLELSRQQEQQKTRMDAWEALQGEWAQQLKSDPELGGAKLPQTLAAANKALQAFGPAAREVLIDAGLGNHPAVIGLLARCAAAIREDSSVRGTPSTEKSLVQLMFDKSVPS
ncbi:MAG: hypothetical protein RL095_1754 [Verrucomicrobiota bacterium]